MPISPEQLGLVYDPYRGWINPNAAQNASMGDPGVTASYMNASNGGQDGGSFWNPASQGDLQYLYRPTQEGHSAVGDYQDVYGKDGKYLSSGDIRPDDTLTQFLIAGGMLGGGVGATMMGLGGAGAAAGGGASGGAGASGGFLGDATAAGYGGLDAAGASTMGGGASLSGGAGGAAGAGGGFLGDATAAGYAGLDAESAATLGGGASVNGGAALGTDWLGMAKKYGPGLLGAIAGGKGGKSGSGAGGAREIDPRLLPYIYGDENNKGGFGYATGLLNAPVAPNGFSRFYPK